MLIDVMANNVMLSKCIQRSTQLKNYLLKASNKDYCFELSPHDFGGPPLYCVQQQQQEKDQPQQQLYQGLCHDDNPHDFYAKIHMQTINLQRKCHNYKSGATKNDNS